MPELPEVETTLRGIAPHVIGRTITSIVARTRKLRHPIPEDLATALTGQTVERMERRGKYLLLHCGDAHLILHLGMSGSLLAIPASTPPGRHDHLDIILDDGTCLRFRDPRRFGLILWTAKEPLSHPLLAGLGPEPLQGDFAGHYLYRKSRGRKVAIKQFIMDSRIVAGVGNIYANEALFRAGISPDRAADSLTAKEAMRLTMSIQETLRDAIAKGETTLRDFTVAENTPGYFRIHLNVYGRGGEPCMTCGTPIRQTHQGGRSTWFCPRCQK